MNLTTPPTTEDPARSLHTVDPTIPPTTEDPARSLHTVDPTMSPICRLDIRRDFEREIPREHGEGTNYLKGVAWCPDGTTVMTASVDGWMRFFDLDVHLVEQGREQDSHHWSGGDAEDNVIMGYRARHMDVPSAGGRTLCPILQNHIPQDDHHNHHDEHHHNHHDEHHNLKYHDRDETVGASLEVNAGDLIYDYAWYPHATVLHDATFCFVMVVRGRPMQLFDGVDGALRCSYVAYTDMDEMAAVYSVGFDPVGQTLYGGGKSVLYSFDVTRPGRDHGTYVTFEKKKVGMHGIVSTIDVAPYGSQLSGVVAMGSYSGVAGLFDVRNKETLCLLEGHIGGVTQVQFSPDGNYLYTGARKDSCMYCWDARYMSGAVYTIQRKSSRTNQRIGFDIEACGRHLVSGGDDGVVRLYDLRDGHEAGHFVGARDCVNGCAWHPSERLLATSSGERQVELQYDTNDTFVGDNYLGIWQYNTVPLKE